MRACFTCDKETQCKPSNSSTSLDRFCLGILLSLFLTILSISVVVSSESFLGLALRGKSLMVWWHWSLLMNYWKLQDETNTFSSSKIHLVSSLMGYPSLCLIITYFLVQTFKQGIIKTTTLWLWVIMLGASRLDTYKLQIINKMTEL